MSDSNYETVLRLLQEMHAENTDLKNQILFLEQTQGPVTIQAPPPPPLDVYDFVQRTLLDAKTLESALRQELTYVRAELYRWKDRAIEAEAFIDRNNLGRMFHSCLRNEIRPPFTRSELDSQGLTWQCNGKISGISSGCCQEQMNTRTQGDSNKSEIPGSAPGCGGTPASGAGGAGGKPESPTTFGDWLVGRIAKEDELSR